MQELTNIDLRRVVSRLPRDVIALLKEGKVLLAGGFIRATIAGEKVNDIDLFGADKEHLNQVAVELTRQREGRKHDTDNAFTVLSLGRTPVQIIHRWLYSDAAGLVLEFDFTIARACVWFRDDKWHSLIDAGFYPDLAAKRLVYCSPVRDEDVGGSLLRARKFLRAGYFIDAENLGAVVARLCSKVDWSRVDDSDPEGRAARIVTSLLREVDPLVVIEGLELADERKI